MCVSVIICKEREREREREREKRKKIWREFIFGIQFIHRYIYVFLDIFYNKNFI